MLTLFANAKTTMKKCQNCSQYLLLKNTRGKSKPELWSPCYLWIVTLLPSSTYLLSVLCSFPWIFKQRRDWLMRLLTIHTGRFNAHLLAYSSCITVSMAFFFYLALPLETCQQFLGTEMTLTRKKIRVPMKVKCLLSSWP